MFENSDRDQGRVNLDDIIKDTLALVAPRAKEENVTLHAQLATGFSIQGDATQLQQVILNLLNNAFDALDALNTSNTINTLDRLNAEENLPKIISIRSELNDDRLLIYVEDNGIGIPDELQSSVFELFKTNKAQGMGVGLWLSKTVINAHRGDIRFTSTPGEGTLFEVSLPTH
jgi:signal transduction histidine kinase